MIDFLRGAVSAWSLSLLLGLFSLQGVVLSVLGTLVLLSGLIYGCAMALRRSTAPSRGGRPEWQLARVWIGAGAILTALGFLLESHVLLPLFGAVVCWGFYRRAGVLLAKRRRSFPGAIRPGRLVAAFMALPLLLVYYTGFAYAGMEVVELYKTSQPPAAEEGDGGESDPQPDGGESEESPALSYAELCRELPDPQDIGFGLGELFEHDGAVDAGCGGEAELVGDSTWVSVGSCGSELRSLAVVGEGHEPVLVYGAPARFAQDEAEDRNLRFAEVSEVAGGEVVIVGTVNGTFAFARSSPALKPGREDAVRCGEIDEVARPYAELQPPLTRLWLELLATEQEWSWPQVREGSADVVFEAPDRLPAYGSCEAALRCRLDGPDVHLVEEGRATVGMEELEAYAPPEAGE